MTVWTKRKTLARIESGFIMQTNHADGHTLTVEPCGPRLSKPLQRDLFDNKINAPLRLVPQEDGLFPGFSQTWRVE